MSYRLRHIDAFLLAVSAEAQFIEQDFPAVFLAQELSDDGKHARTRDSPGLPQTAVLQDPHHLTGRAVFLECGIGKISGLNGQDLRGAAVALALGAMALKACP